MKKQAFAILVAVGFSFSAFAGNNPRIDQALMESLTEKSELKAELRQRRVVTEPKVNSRYRGGLEVIEVGDELGGFTSSRSGDQTVKLNHSAH